MAPESLAGAYQGDVERLRTGLAHQGELAVDRSMRGVDLAEGRGHERRLREGGRFQVLVPGQLCGEVFDIGGD